MSTTMFPLFVSPQPTARAEMPELTKACCCVHHSNHHSPAPRSITAPNTPSSTASKPSPQTVFAEAGEARRRMEQCRAWASVVAEAARDAVSVRVGAVEERDSAFPSAYKGATCEECNLPIATVPLKRASEPPPPLWERRANANMRTRSTSPVAAAARAGSESANNASDNVTSGRSRKRIPVMLVDNAAKQEPALTPIASHGPVPAFASAAHSVVVGSKSPSHRPPLSLRPQTSRVVRAQAASHGHSRSHSHNQQTRPASRSRSPEPEQPTDHPAQAERES